MAHKQKVAIEKKIEIVLECLGNQICVSEAARNLGVDYWSVKNWIRIYEAEGIEGLTRKRNRVYSKELKLSAVKDYINHGGSIQDICAKYKISDSHVFRNWVKMYNAHGDFNSVKHSGGGSYMKQGRDTTREERLEIVKDCLASGKNYGEMALKYKVSYQQVRTWTLRFEAMGEGGLEDRRGKRKKDQTPRTELEAEQIEIEDALNATRAAVAEGIVAGGGTAYVIASKAADKLVASLEGDEKTGAAIVAKALKAPIMQIAANAGVEGAVILNTVAGSDNVNFGYDAANDTYGDMIDLGIVDPTKVCRSAMENAASVAAMVLTTESLVADIPEKNPPMPANPDMGGMY